MSLLLQGVERGPARLTASGGWGAGWSGSSVPCRTRGHTGPSHALVPTASCAASPMAMPPHKLSHLPAKRLPSAPRLPPAMSHNPPIHPGFGGCVIHRGCSPLTLGMSTPYTLGVVIVDTLVIDSTAQSSYSCITPASEEERWDTQHAPGEDPSAPAVIANDASAGAAIAAQPASQRQDVLRAVTTAATVSASFGKKVTSGRRITRTTSFRTLSRHRDNSVLHRRVRRTR